MWDVFAWIAVFLLGGFVTMVAGSVFIWAVFWMQNGGGDD